MVNIFLRLLSSITGFIFGIIFCFSCVLLFFALLAYVSDQPFQLPRGGGGWAIFHLGIGLWFARFFYRYEKVVILIRKVFIKKDSKIFSFETKFDRMRIVFLGLWFVIACLYIIFGDDRQFRRLDLLDLRYWGGTEWSAVRLVFIPMLIIFFGLPFFRNVYIWIKSGK